MACGIMGWVPWWREVSVRDDVSMPCTVRRVVVRGSKVQDVGTGMGEMCRVVVGWRVAVLSQICVPFVVQWVRCCRRVHRTKVGRMAGRRRVMVLVQVL